MRLEALDSGHPVHAVLVVSNFRGKKFILYTVLERVELEF